MAKRELQAKMATLLRQCARTVRPPSLRCGVEILKGSLSVRPILIISFAFC